MGTTKPRRINFLRGYFVLVFWGKCGKFKLLSMEVKMTHAIKWNIDDFVAFKEGADTFVGRVRKISIDQDGVAIYVHFDPSEHWRKISQDDCIHCNVTFPV